MSKELHDSPSQNLPHRIRPILTQLYLLYFRQSVHSQLSSAQLSILMNLETQGNMRVSHIARTEDIRMPTASNAISQLENLGMVERIRDTSDRRGVTVALTDQGRKELDSIGAERDAQFEKFLESLSEEDYQKAGDVVPILEKLLETYLQHDKEKK